MLENTIQDLQKAPPKVEAYKGGSSKNKHFKFEGKLQPEEEEDEFNEESYIEDDYQFS